MTETSTRIDPAARSLRGFYPSGWACLGLLALGVLGGGCAQIIGLEEREQAPGVIDENTERITSEACVSYCDEVMKACSGKLSVYTTRFTCIDVCNHLEPGTDNEPAGDTLACRARQANLAKKGSAAEFCPSAGPSGGEACGGACPAWCHLLEQACPDDYAGLANCENACGALESAGPFNADDYYNGDTLECRLIHVSAAFDNPAHCAHAAFAASAFCLADGSDQDPTCAVYCRNVMGACTGDNAQYESEGQCLSVCDSLSVGKLSDTGNNTVGCRQYHAGAALADPEHHCPHAGPTGGGVCEDSKSPGTCPAYCQLRSGACDKEDRTVCEEACNVAFKNKGADGATDYAVKTAEAKDDLNCRFLQLSRAAEGDTGACDHVGPLATCP